MDRNFLTKITSVIIAVLIIAVITGYIVFLLNCKAAPLKHLIPLLIPLVISIILVSVYDDKMDCDSGKGI